MQTGKENHFLALLVSGSHGPEMMWGVQIFVHPMAVALGLVPDLDKLTVMRNHSRLCHGPARAIRGVPCVAGEGFWGRENLN